MNDSEYDEFAELERRFNAISSNSTDETKVNGKDMVEVISKNGNIQKKRTYEINDVVEYTIRGNYSFSNSLSNKLRNNSSNVINLCKNNRMVGKVSSFHSDKKYVYVDTIIPIGLESTESSASIIIETNDIICLSPISLTDFNTKMESILENVETSNVDYYISELNSKNKRIFEVEKKKEEERIKKEKEEKEKSLVADKIKAIAEDIHTGNWDFNELQASDFRPSSGYKYKLTIRFPEFTIKNSKGMEHNIVDFYLSIFFDQNFKSYGTIYGKRGKLSVEEYETTYGHSHMHTDSYFGWQNMCLGSGTELYYAISSLATSSTFDEKLLTKILLLFHSYVVWESLEGTPYIDFARVSRKGGGTTLFVPTQANKDNAYNSYIRSKERNNTLLPLKLTQVNTFNKFVVEYNKIEDELVTNVSNNELTFKSSDGVYTPMVVQRVSQSTIDNYNANLTGRGDNGKIRFKGEFFHTTIIGSTISTSLKKVPHPEITKAVVSKLEENINNYYLINKRYELSGV